MKKIIFVIILALFSYNAKAVEYKVEKVIEIKNNLNYEGLLDNSMYDYHVEMLYKNNKIAGRFIAIEFKDLIAKNYPINEESKNKLLIRCTAENGESITYSYSQIDEDVTALPTYLVIKVIKGRIGDTIDVHFDKGNKMETAPIDLELDKAIDTKIKILFDDKTDKIKPDFLKPGSLIFLSNKSTKYWLKNLKKIELLYPVM
ncbi:MAG: hypothetical protein WCR42_02530 [bacterium]